jgi:hypothetical protein
MLGLLLHEELDTLVAGSREEGGVVETANGRKFDALVEVELVDAHEAGAAAVCWRSPESLGGLEFDALVDEHVEVELVEVEPLGCRWAAGLLQPQLDCWLVVMAATAAVSLVTCAVRSAVTEFSVGALFAALRVDFLRPSL